MNDIELILTTCKNYSLETHELLRNFDFVNKDCSRVNKSGDHLVKLDNIADLLSEKHFSLNNKIYGFVSEEREDMIVTNEKGEYIVTIDPLDGSQNVNVGFNVGAIFGIYRTNKLNEIKNGHDLIAAAYTVFSTSMQFVAAYNKTINCYRYDFKNDQWICYKKNHQMPKKSSFYSINEGYSNLFYENTRMFVHRLKPKSLRWMCCMVTDIHRCIMEGGCFMYPTRKSDLGEKNLPKAKLRLVYELYPMSFIWECAGGKAYISMNKKSILDTPFPKNNLHKKNGCYFITNQEDILF